MEIRRSRTQITYAIAQFVISSGTGAPVAQGRAILNLDLNCAAEMECYREIRLIFGLIRCEKSEKVNNDW